MTDHYQVFENRNRILSLGGSYTTLTVREVTAGTWLARRPRVDVRGADSAIPANDAGVFRKMN